MKQRWDMNKFALKISRMEGKKVEVNIAQIKEILRCTNDLLDGKFYDIIEHPHMFIKL